MSLNCWALLMTSSSDWGKVATTSLARREISDLRNQLRHCWGVASTLQRLRHRHHSCMWSAICVEAVCLKFESSSRPLSWQMGNWKKVKNALAKDSKVTWDPDFSSTYHLDDGPVRVHWSNLNWMELSMMLFEEHHRWNVMIWLAGSSPTFPSNLGMSEGSLVGITG